MDNPERVTYFAATDTRGKRTPFGIKQKDRARHMYVIGKTGMGKSTLIQNMAIQDIRNGEGLAFIDPHGDAAERLLSFIPEHRMKDVVYFAPFDLERPVAFNVMENVSYERRHLVVSGLLATLKKMWADVWSPKFEYFLTNTLLALLEYPQGTLLDADRLFLDEAFRATVLRHVADQTVREFWEKEYNGKLPEPDRRAALSLRNKITLLTGNPYIRNIIGAPQSSFNLREVMDGRKIFIANLSRGLIGESNMRLLGSMLTTSFFLAASSRADVGADGLTNLAPFYYYVDEFQNFANDTFSTILSEARKYKLALIISHQYLEQMDAVVRAAVFGNVGTFVTFRVGPIDAEVLGPFFAPEFSKEDLIRLGVGQVYLTLMIDFVSSRPFSAIIIPAIAYPPRSFREEVKAASREQFGIDPLPLPETLREVLQSIGETKEHKEGVERKARQQELQEVLTKAAAPEPRSVVQAKPPFEVPEETLRSVFKDEL